MPVAAADDRKDFGCWSSVTISPDSLVLYMVFKQIAAFLEGKWIIDHRTAVGTKGDLDRWYHPPAQPKSVDYSVAASSPAQMDFVFIDVPPDGNYQPALVLASEVDRAASIAQVMADVALAETPSR